MKLAWMLEVICGLTLLNSGTVGAQIVSDGTLPNNSIVIPKGNIIQIDGGTKAGNNLFHSFREFSVPTNNTAVFNNALEIQNIFSRVTGSSISNIDGIIKANGTANLFLINPNGIVFGPNAKLNIGGSFIASTANRVIFADGIEYSAINSQTTPLLTINVPVGLGFGSSPGRIINQSRATSDISLIGRFGESDEFISGLQVKNGKTLALVGGNVELNRGYLTANEGRVELGSVGGDSTVSLIPIEQGWQLGYGNVRAFEDISLSSRAKIDTSGYTGGAVQLQGRQLNILGGSSILTKTFGRGQSGKLIINATESVLISGLESLLSTDASGGSSGNAEGINITARRLTIEDAGRISSNTVGTGDGGAIAVNVSELIIQDRGRIFANSGFTGKGGTITIEATDKVELIGNSGFITTLATDRGAGGSIVINTNLLKIDGDFRVAADSSNSGRAGDITVNASDILIGKLSRISVRIESSGNGGNIVLNTERLTMSDGGGILADTIALSTGKGGTITINASESVTATGSFTPDDEMADPILSGIFTETKGTGSAGNIFINTNNLNVTDRAQITASTTGFGAAGNIFIGASTFSINNGGQLLTTTAGIQNAGNISIQSDNLTLNGIGSGIFANTEGGSNGQGGNISLNSRNTNINDSATISVNSQGTGIGGDITLQGDRLTLNNQAFLSATTLSTDGGNITLNLNDRLLLRNGSNISATAGLAGGGGDGGNITIDSPFIIAVLEEDSDITANAFEGSGGNINITTQGIFGIQPQPEQTPRSDITASSEFGIQGSVNIINPDTNLVNRLVEFPENPVDAAQLVAQNVCRVDRLIGSSFSVTGRGGLPPNPGDPVTPDSKIDWATRSQQEKKPPVILKERSQHQQPTIQQVQGWRREADGTIILTADASQVTPQSTTFNSPGCQ